MKSVLVGAVQAPFVVGGAVILVSELLRNLEPRGLRVLREMREAGGSGCAASPGSVIDCLTEELR